MFSGCPFHCEDIRGPFGEAQRISHKLGLIYDFKSQELTQNYDKVADV